MCVRHVPENRTCVQHRAGLVQVVWFGSGWVQVWFKRSAWFKFGSGVVQLVWSDSGLV